MFIVAQPVMRNFKSPLGAVSALGNPPTDRLDELRNILLAVLGMASITFAVAGFGILSPAGGVDPSDSSLRVDSAGAYHYADVLEPGSRGSAVDI